jgi:hypothetical protein
MRNRFKLTSARRKQGGYALLLVVFLTALVLVGSMSIGLRVLTEGRREKEEDMIWRGKQYTRGIKLFYQKYGRFPKSMDDLTKPGNGNVRFMRQAYKDPMNKEDGAWRLIYVGPAGQLIGSLKPQQGNVLMPGAPGAAGVGQPGTPAGSSAFGSSTFGSTPANPTGGAFPGGTTAAPGTGTGTTATATTGSGTGAQGTDTTSNGDPPIPMGDTPVIIGGNIIGVGSKINESSVIVYEKAKNYRLFEFIWDPSKDMGVVGLAPGTQLGAPGATPGAPGQPGTPGTGAQPGPGTTPPQTPPTTPQNPNQ